MSYTDGVLSIALDTDFFLNLVPEVKGEEGDEILSTARIYTQLFQMLGIDINAQLTLNTVGNDIVLTISVLSASFEVGFTLTEMVA